MGVDGLIAADPGVIWLAKKHCPSVPLHLSTQAHSVNGAAVAFWREAGVERINLARELGFKQIRALAEAFPGVDFEVFVHGAMCLALSGHCLLSAWVNNRPANQGRCTQPCRFEYRGLSLLVEEQKRSGEALWEIREGEAFSGFWAPQDLCLLRYVGCLADLGVRALKLEGRTKSGGYVAQIADVYRTALDRHARREGRSRLRKGGDFHGGVARRIVSYGVTPSVHGLFPSPQKGGGSPGRFAPPARGGAAC